MARRIFITLVGSIALLVILVALMVAGKLESSAVNKILLALPAGLVLMCAGATLVAGSATGNRRRWSNRAAATRYGGTTRFTQWPVSNRERRARREAACLVLVGAGIALWVAAPIAIVASGAHWTQILGHHRYAMPVWALLAGASVIAALYLVGVLAYVLRRRKR